MAGRCGFGVGDDDSAGRALPLFKWYATHELTDEVFQQLPMVEITIAPYEIVAKARKWKQIDPERVQEGLLEASRDE